jgi:hypothetical protein
MNAATLTAALTSYLPAELAAKLVDEFLALRRDALTSTLGRSSAGKFVEVLVQALQHRERGSYEPKPAVDEYLKGVESRAGLPDDLRICAARVGRAIYTLRNKRNIAHLGTVDPNVFDLRFTYSAAQWVMAELIRQGSGVPMVEAGLMVAEVQQPLHLLVEHAGGERVVHAAVTVREELLILFHSAYPAPLTANEVYDSLKRRKRDTVRRALAGLWDAKTVLGKREGGPFTLSQAGFDLAVEVVNRVASGA